MPRRPFPIGLDRTHALALGLISSLAAFPAVALEIEIEGVRSNEGHVNVLVWTKGDGFPSDADKALHRFTTGASTETIRFVVEDLPPGRYSVSAIHDENANGDLDRNFLGMPSEGAAISGDGMGFFGPRPFEETLVDVGDDPIRLEMRYWQP